MTKVYKILMLSLAVLLFTGAVMFFYRTIVAPPHKITFGNQYLTSINADINNISAQLNDYSLDSLYTVVTEEISFMWRDSAISAKEHDNLTFSFVKKYVPTYTFKCQDKFKKSEWKEMELQNMKSHIAEIRNITTSEKVTVIEGDNLNSLNAVTNVLVSYYEAKSATNATGYAGIESAKQKIARAKKYANMAPLNNCRQLVSSLNSVASRLEQAHYLYLSGQVERLRNWQNYTVNSYDDLAMDVASKLKEYKNNAKSVYGNISNIGALEDRASQYYNSSNFTSNSNN